MVLLQFLFEPAKVSNWGVLPYCFLGAFICLYLGDVSESLTQGHQFPELAAGLGEHGGDEPQQFVDDEVHDGEVTQVPPLLGTVVLVVPQDRLYAVAPDLQQSPLVLLVGAD